MFTLVFSGSTAIIDDSGNVSITGAADSTLTFTFNNTVVTIDQSGNVKFGLASGAAFDITRGGSASDGLVLVSKLIAFFNAHIHTDPQGGDTGVPTVPMTIADVDSTLIDIQS